MKKMCLLLSVVFTLIFAPVLRADEGMWIPILIEKYNIKLMQEKGFKLSAEDIYSVNKASMKDAIVHFGGGCTGELISNDGLLITNHHCGYGQIQRHSSVDKDYLTNGFWAMSAREELPNPGLTVTFLKRMEDVTDRVLKGVTENLSVSARESTIESNILVITKEAVAGTGYVAVVKPFYMGKQYFLFVNEVFRDVRLVGAPPSAIGKFGGETDNWVWPRHTGDFSLFRIYAGKDNKPADYSLENIPYRPAYFFPVSLKGVNDGDFTMVFGYPGTTSKYVPSYHIDMVKNYLNPKMIEIRGIKIDIMEEAMNTDPLLRLQYSAKKSSLANSWKKWIGESQGLERMGTIDIKRAYEEKLTQWIKNDISRSGKYGDILPRYKELYSKFRDYNLVNSFTSEVFFNYGAEAIGFARNIKTLEDLIKNKGDEDQINMAKINLQAFASGFFKNYNMETDKKLFIAVMTLYNKNLEEKWQAPEFIKLKNSCNGDFAEVADELYRKTIFAEEKKFKYFVSNMNSASIAKLHKDPFYQLATGVTGFLAEKVRPDLQALNSELQQLNTDYMTLQLEYASDKVFYPDANSTLRVAYGNVKGYYSNDAVYYTHYTTLKGIIEKDNPEIYDYDVPEKLKELYRNKDYGKYSHNGEVPVCFIATNHTTGGNSGSPVLNADGHLIGINFDRAWEGVASDLAYNPDQSRNISLDIRYALFIIDKFAGAGYL
ncbi:MAG: S46 family peptidase, partial [Bacteroidia bacterium]|nr:S46 family peptidase [Bacteroidia bacterium]